MARFKKLSLDTNGGAGYVVKVTGGQIVGFVFGNTNAAWRYVKLYNAASVTVGTTVPDVTIGVGPGSTVALAGAQITELDTFNVGICIAGTTLPADNSAVDPTAGDLPVTLWYK